MLLVLRCASGARFFSLRLKKKGVRPFFSLPGSGRRLFFRTVHLDEFIADDLLDDLAAALEIASAMPRTYRRTARLASSLPESRSPRRRGMVGIHHPTTGMPSLLASVTAPFW
jgi:hypothetical protein